MPDKDLVMEFASFHEVLDGYAQRLSEEGIFFETSEPRDVGAEVAFDVRIRDGFSVLKGAGEVVQTRDDGLFVRLLHLDQPSLKLLPKLLEHYRRKGVPLMELPRKPEVASAADELEVEMPAEEPEARSAPDPELSVDELFDRNGADSEPAKGFGLTLDDLEAEFRTESASADASAEVEVETDIDWESRQSQAEPEALLIEAEDLVDLSPQDGAALEIAEQVEPAIEVVDAQRSRDIDAGLPWLPEEPEKSSRKDLWVILLLMLLGAALGAVFYVFVIRPRAQGSWRPTPAESVQAKAVPTASSQTGLVPASSSAEPTASKPSEATQGVDLPEIAPLGSPAPVVATQKAMTGVDRITWGDEAGETVVTLWADGSFQAEQIDDFRINGERPREVVRIRGVQRPCAQRRIELQTDHVRRIRTGMHEDNGVNSLHIVADLVDVEVELLRTEAAGEQLRVYFAKTG
jgi:hypothetical protein